MSSDAEFVSSLQREAATTPAVRDDVVARTQAELAAGTFESNVNLETVMDGLLADL